MFKLLPLVGIIFKAFSSPNQLVSVTHSFFHCGPNSVKMEVYYHQNQIRFTACEICSWCLAFKGISIHVPEPKTSTICSIRHRISAALLDLQRQDQERIKGSLGVFGSSA